MTKQSSQANIPDQSEFESWTSERVREHVLDKAIVFAPGGTSRWYFLEFGDIKTGYGKAEQFVDYSRRALRRTVEIVSMMAADGFNTIFVVGNMPDQNTRTSEYNQNLSWAYNMLVDDTATQLYDEHDLGVLFRGGWEEAFARVGAEANLLTHCRQLEESTRGRPCWLIWLANDSDIIPRSLASIVAARLGATGEFPDRTTLCLAYYGRPIEQAAIFLSNNKLSVRNMCPPLVTLGDLYFTVTPSYYMDRIQWRRILYDHLFARRGHYRDYASIEPQAFKDLQDFYKSNEGVTMGVGTYDVSTQTWRPSLRK